MSKFPWTTIENHGGIAGSLKMGPPHSFAYARGLDFRTDPTRMRMVVDPAKDSGTTVTDLVTDMIRLPSGKFVATGNAGSVYTRQAANNGTWTKLGTTLTDVSAACGMLYNLQQDMVYLPGNKNIHTITNADGRFGGAITVNNNALTRTLDRSQTGHTATYATGIALNEGATHRLYVTPTIEPMGSVKLWVDAKGTADVTIIMHDAADNTIGQVTKTAATLTNAAVNEFVFATPVRNTVKPNASTYHFHALHGAVGTGSTLGCTVASDFSTAEFETWVDMLIGTPYGNGMHPMIQFLQYMLIGNERYVTAWEVLGPGTPTNFEYNRHRLVLEPGFAVTSFALWGEYVVVAAERRATSTANVIDSGRIYFWDGLSAGWNFAIDTPEGAPYSLYSYRNVISYIAAGALWSTVGGQPVKIAQLPNSQNDTTTTPLMINYPNMMAVQGTILHFGFASDTTHRALEHGIYTYGAADKNYNESFGFTFRSSQGGLTNAANGTILMHVGMVRNFGQMLYASYYDNGSYFVDQVDPTRGPSASTPSRWESLIYDAGRIDKRKKATYMRIDVASDTFGGFPASSSLRMYYKINRQLVWQQTANYTSFTTAGEQSFRMPLNAEFNEIQLAYEIQGVANPNVLGVTLMVESLADEAD